MKRSPALSPILQSIIIVFVVIISIVFLIIKLHDRSIYKDHIQFERWFSVKWPKPSDNESTRTAASTAVINELLGQHTLVIKEQDELGAVTNEIKNIGAPATTADVQQLIELQEKKTKLDNSIEFNLQKFAAMCSLAYDAGFEKETAALGYKRPSCGCF